ncbi:pilin [Modicisalibacter tunisiensis]|nr:pilin [Modicisalibacter tunisiensis]
MTRTARGQGGFTLIELMIVVAIVGILAAIAVPRYQDYVARSQLSEALTLAAGQKTAVSEIYAQTGSCPANTSGNSNGLPVADNISGEYVASVDVGGTATGANPTGCQITATMKSTSGNNISADIAEKKLRLTMTDNGGSYSWDCTSNAPQSLLPQSCAGGGL